MSIDERLPNRWMFVAAGIVMQLCIPIPGNWSIFRIPLMKSHGWTAAQVSIPYAIFGGFLVVGSIIGGRWQDKVGPRIVAATGGIVLAMGLLLASQIGTTLWGLYIAYGLLGGLGVGLASIPPIATCIKWFPDMRGFTTGLVFLGGGAGSLIGGVVGPLLIVGIGVYSAFASLGIILGFLVVVSGSTLRNPPAGWQPPGWTPSRPPQDYAPSEVLRSRQFYLLWFIYLFWIAPGLMVISQAVPFAQEMGGLTPVVAGAALTVMAIFNGLGRPGFGWISDKIGRNQAATVAQVVQIVSLLLVLPNARSFAMFTIGISLIGFAQGGASVLVTVCIADYFGTRDFGINYVLFSTVWGAASLFGPIWALGRATTGSWMGAFLASAFLSAAAAVLAFITKVPPRRGA